MKEQVQRLNKTPGVETQAGVLQTGVTQTANMGYVQQKESKGSKLAKTLGMVTDTAIKGYELYQGQKDEEAMNQFYTDRLSTIEELNTLNSDADRALYLQDKMKSLSNEGVNEKYRESFIQTFSGKYNQALAGAKIEGYQAQENELFKRLSTEVNNENFSYEALISEFGTKIRKQNAHKIYATAILQNAQLDLADVKTDEDLLIFNEKFNQVKEIYNNNPYAGGNASQNGMTVNTNFKNSFNGLIATKKAALKTKWTETEENLSTTQPGYSTYSKHIENGLKYGHISPTKANTSATKELRKYVQKDTQAAVASFKNIDAGKIPGAYQKLATDSMKSIEKNLQRQVQLKMKSKEEAAQEYAGYEKLFQTSAQQAALTLDLEDGTVYNKASINKENREGYAEQLNQKLLQLFTNPNFTEFDSDDINSIRVKHPDVFKKSINTTVGQAISNLNEDNYENNKQAILGLNLKTGNNILNNVNADQRDSIILMNALPSFAAYKAAMDKKNKTGYDYKQERIPADYKTRYNDLIDNAPLGEKVNTELKIKALLFATEGANPEAIFKSFEASNKKVITENIQYNESIYSNFKGSTFNDENGVPKVEYIGKAIESVLKEKNLDLDEKNKYSLKVQDNKLYIYSYGTNILKVGGYDISDKVKQYNKEGSKDSTKKTAETRIFPSLAPFTDTVDAIGKGLETSISKLGSKAVGAVLDAGPIDFIQKTFDIRVNDEKTYKED